MSGRKAAGCFSKRCLTAETTNGIEDTVPVRQAASIVINSQTRDSAALQTAHNLLSSMYLDSVFCRSYETFCYDLKCCRLSMLLLGMGGEAETID